MKKKNLMVVLIIVAAFLMILPINASASLYSGAWEPTFDNGFYKYSLVFTAIGSGSFFMYDDVGTPTPGSDLLLLNSVNLSNLIYFDTIGSNWYASLDPTITTGDYLLGSTNRFRFYFYDGSSYYTTYDRDDVFAGKEYSLYDLNTTTTVKVIGAAPVPIPATVWIFGAGLVGLVGIRRKLKS